MSYNNRGYMPSGRVHETLNIAALCIAIAILLFFKVIHQGICEFTLMWIIGTFYISPDLDADYSRSKNRIGGFKYLFNFFHHRGILHNSSFWFCLFLVFLFLEHGWIGVGLMGASMVNIILDRVT